MVEHLAFPLVGAMVIAVVWAMAEAVSTGPMRRHRLETFAGRHRLVVTPDNGNQIIAYLATTRRWRAAGLALAATLYLAWQAPRATIGVNALTLLAGWFAGALAAEARVGHLLHGARRAAALVRREPRAYLPRGAWSLVPGCALLSLAVGGATAVVAARRDGVDGLRATLCLIAAVAVAVLVRLGQRLVLGRPQPLVAPDLRAADDAIRSRSLHVLAGGGAALVLYLVLGQLQAVEPALDRTRYLDPLMVAVAIGGLVVPAIGYSVATARWPVTGRVPPAGAQT